MSLLSIVILHATFLQSFDLARKVRDPQAGADFS